MKWSDFKGGWLVTAAPVANQRAKPTAERSGARNLISEPEQKTGPFLDGCKSRPEIRKRYYTPQVVDATSQTSPLWGRSQPRTESALKRGTANWFQYFLMNVEQYRRRRTMEERSVIRQSVNVTRVVRNQRPHPHVLTKHIIQPRLDTW